MRSMPSSHRFGRAIRGRRKLTGPSQSALAATWVSIVMAMVGWPIPDGEAAPPVDVNTCGQIFSGNGRLSGDLDCGAFAGNAVTIQGGMLDLQGFTLTATAPFGAVACEKSCKVVSDPPSGTITSDGRGTIFAVTSDIGLIMPRAHLQVSDVLINDGRLSTKFGDITVTDSTITGIVDPASSGSISGIKTFSGIVRLLRSVVTGNAGTGVQSAKIKIIDSEVSNNGGDGVSAGFETTVIRNSTISANGLTGVSGLRIKVVDSTIIGNGAAGIAGDVSSRGTIPGRVKIVRSDISSNLGQGIAGFPKRITVRDSTIDNNGSEGIRQDLSQTLEGAVVRLTGSTVTGNALDGIAQSDTLPRCRLKAKGSTVTGNGTDASCGVLRTCADLSSCDPPKVSLTTCGTSYDANSGFPGVSWGVCSLD